MKYVLFRWTSDSFAVTGWGYFWLGLTVMAIAAIGKR